ncbi:hypothetical protein WJX74_011066 [Apatococcus lobatus]|uniref:methylated diphthine methylhydrolase n=1 Tax=Apatococcus lobatus TaxID=904363 RepID=A0AAW1R0L8_9CHLO
MVLSVDSHRQPGSGTVLAASTASGQAAQVQARESELKITQRWSAHELEVWTAAFDHWQGNLLHTGADDAVWHGWDLRDCATPAFSIRKEHKAGVCCIQSHPQQEHIICTGSYDESARIWDCRSMSRPLLSAKLATGGGVWRLRWHPQDPDLLLAACMQEGFKVLRCGSRFNAIYMQQHYGAQRTLAYGADWSYAANQPQLVATCSFYDRQVKVMDALLDVAASMSTGCGTPGGQEELSGSEGGAVDTEKGPAEEDRGARSEQSTRFRGVYKNRHDGKWRAEITSGRRKKSLGLYGSEEEAAQAYDRAALSLRGPGAFTNFAASRNNYAAIGRLTAGDPGSSKPSAGSRSLAAANSPTASRFMGVFWASDRQQWEARIWTRAGDQHRLVGRYESAEAAARAYDQAAVALHGPEAFTNFSGTASPASVPTDMHQAAMNSSPAHRMPRNALGKGSSKFRGVSWHKDNMKWRATIFKGSKPVHIGYFDSQETAARAYDQESLKLRGPNSNLNFPLSSYAVTLPMERVQPPAVLGSSHITDTEPASELLRDEHIWREMQEASRSTTTAVPTLVPQSTGHATSDTIDAATMRALQLHDARLLEQNWQFLMALRASLACTPPALAQQALTSLLAACASSAPQQALAAQLQTHLTSLAQASFNGIPPPQSTTSTAQHRSQKRSSKPDPGMPSLSQAAHAHQSYQALSQTWSPLDSDSIPGSSQLPQVPAARASGSADTSSLLPGGLGSFGQGFLNMSRPGSASGSRPPSAQHLSDLGPLHSSSPTLEATLLHHQRASSSPSSLVHLLADPAGPSQGLQRPMSDPSRFDQRSASSSLRWGDKGLRTDLTSLHRQRPPLNGRRISTENKDHNGGSAPRNDHPAYSAAPDQEMPAPPKRPRVL